MGLRWKHRSVEVNLGVAYDRRQADTFTNRSRQYLRKASKTYIKPLLKLPHSKNWSIALQTIVLLVASFTLLMFMLFGPVADSDEWTQDILPSNITSALPSTDVRQLNISSPPHSQTQTESVGPSLLQHASINPHQEEKPSHKALRLAKISQAEKKKQTAVSVSVDQPAQAREPKILLRVVPSGKLEVYFDKSRKHSSPTVCRIYNGCVDSSGSLTFDSFMKAHYKSLKACGLSNTKFVDDPFHFSQKDSSLKGKDLFVNQLRYHMPHLVSDALSLSYAMSVVTGRYSLSRLLPPNSKELHPVTIAQSKLRKLDPQSWSPQLISLLPYQAQVNTSEELFSLSPQSGALKGSVCFRSIVSFGSQLYSQVSKVRFFENNALFDGGAHWSRLPKASQTLKSRTGGAECKPIVVVLNRPPAEARTLSNIDEIRERFDELKMTADFKVVAGSVFHVEFMNNSFAGQLKVMQEADVVLASHGAALANLIFSRIGTPVIEVFPFSKYWRNPANRYIPSNSIDKYPQREKLTYQPVPFYYIFPSLSLLCRSL